MFTQTNINTDEMFPYLTEFIQFSDHPNTHFNFPSSSSSPSPIAIPVSDFESFPPDPVAMKSELSHKSSGGCTSFSSPAAVVSYGNNNYYGGSSSSFHVTCTPAVNDQNLIMQRSISSHSLIVKNGDGFSASGLLSSPPACVDLNNSSVRNVFSTGDIQGMKQMYKSNRCESPLKQELKMIEDMGKACKYSHEEKKERIERYKIKRNQRNFNKKIKYECRKTLADSRPRIRGRFAKNDELIDKINYPNNQWDQPIVIEEDEEEDEENWISFLMQYQQI